MLPLLVKTLLEAYVKYVVDAMTLAFLSQREVVVLLFATELYESGVNGKPKVEQVGQVTALVPRVYTKGDENVVVAVWSSW